MCCDGDVGLGAVGRDAHHVGAALVRALLRSRRVPIPGSSSTAMLGRATAPSAAVVDQLEVVDRRRPVLSDEPPSPSPCETSITGRRLRRARARWRATCSRVNWCADRVRAVAQRRRREPERTLVHLIGSRTHPLRDVLRRRAPPPRS